MPTRDRVRAALGGDRDYPQIGRDWGIPAGRLYLIANGRPADCSDGRDGRAQALVNPREVNPTGRADVHEWVKVRAYRDASMRSAR